MFRFIKLCIWIFVISAIVLFWKYSQFENTILTEEEISLEVTGWWFQTALIDAGANSLLTKIYLSRNTPDFGLQKWKYTIAAGSNVKEYMDALKNPIHENDIHITFLEGWNIFDIDEYLSEKWFIRVWEFVSFAENFCNPNLYPKDQAGKACDLKNDFPFLSDAESLEGYLYPDTYAINPNTFSVHGLSKKMLQNFQKKLIESRIIQDMWNIELQDLIILSSIVEKEEKNPSEKSTVAGILKKRLNENWMIGADITVCYAHRLTSEQCKLSVTKHLYDKNDYNTRQMTWLPAGPIGNPSANTIEATLNHKDTPYYYYLHDITTGKIYYGRNETEHNRNKGLYIR